ncbi:MAG: sensor domain-containing diguanylate cyclase [Pseudoxanthomonas sp.]
MPQRSQTLPILVRAFVVLVCCLLALAEFWRTAESRRDALEATQQASINLSRSVAQHASDTLLIDDGVVRGIVEQLETHGVRDQILQSLHPFLVREAAQSSRLHGLFVYDASGNWITSSLGVTPSPINNADRDYFIHHRSIDDRKPFLGEPIVSRSDGTWVITISRRFNDAQGNFAGVVMASIRTRYFARFYEGYDIGQEGVIALINDVGQVCARLPEGDTIGQSIRGSRAFETMQAGMSGTMRFPSPVDGKPRVAAFHRVDGFPLIGVAAFSREEALAPWRRETDLHVALTLLAILLLGCMGLWLSRQLRARQAAEDQLLQWARTDALTGVGNRRAFDERLQEEAQRARRQGTSLGLLMIDIDHFKAFNDTYGHQAGDECLQRVAVAVQQCARRATDFAARYGGEELAIIVPDVERHALEALAHAVCAAVCALQIPHAQSKTAAVVTVSAGAARWRNVDADPAALLAAADRCLYDAKAAGRNRVAMA